MNISNVVGSIFNYYNAGTHAQPMLCRNKLDLAMWLRGFATACAAVRLGVAVP